MRGNSTWSSKCPRGIAGIATERWGIAFAACGIAESVRGIAESRVRGIAGTRLALARPLAQLRGLNWEEASQLNYALPSANCTCLGRGVDDLEHLADEATRVDLGEIWPLLRR